VRSKFGISDQLAQSIRPCSAVIEPTETLILAWDHPSTRHRCRNRLVSWCSVRTAHRKAEDRLAAGRRWRLIFH